MKYNYFYKSFSREVLHSSNTQISLWLECAGDKEQSVEVPNQTYIYKCEMSL